MAWYCHCHWTRVIYALLGGTILWLFKMYPDFGIFNMRWGLFLTCIFSPPSLSQWRWKRLELQVTSAQDLWADEWLICLTTEYWLYISDVSCIVCGPSDGTFLCYLFSSYSWVLYFDTSMVTTARGKHTYNKNQAYISISCFQMSIQRTRKIYFASDHQTQTVIHVYWNADHARHTHFKIIKSKI